MRWLLLFLVGVLLTAAGPNASFPPGPYNARQTSSGTITTTGTFQVPAGLTYDQGRQTAYIQNQGANPMYVYIVVGTGTSCSAATQAKSIALYPPTASAAGDTLNLAFNNMVYINTICITGTSGDAFAYGY